MTADEEMTQIKRELWLRGDLRHITREGPQRDAYDFIAGRSRAKQILVPFVLNFHRRLGKTFLSVLFCVEPCIRAAGVFTKLAAPTLTQAANILEEHWSTLMSLCPSELIPDPFRGEKFTFRNPRWGPKSRYIKSVLQLYGVKNDRGDKMRGSSSDTVALDECREMQSLAYTWRQVIIPTFRNRPDPLGIMISTPPENMDHEFVTQFIPEARRHGRYSCVPAAEDSTWTKEEDEAFALSMGGRNSNAYRREIQCELIADTTRLIIPEFADRDNFQSGELKNEFIVDDSPRPMAFFAYSCGDMGGAGKKTDHTGIIFGFVDRESGIFWQEDELFIRDADSQTIAEVWLAKMKDLYDPEVLRHAGKFVAGREYYIDAPVQQTRDFNSIWGLPVQGVQKQDSESGRRWLRSLYAQGKIRIRSRCKETIYQLRNGTRTPSGDFCRSPRLGHCDLISAQIDLMRVIDFERDPNREILFDASTHFVPRPKNQNGWSDVLGARRHGR